MCIRDRDTVGLVRIRGRQKRRCAAPTLDILGTASSIRPVVLGLRRNDGSWNRCGFRHQSLDGSFGSKARRQTEDEGLAAADDALCLSCASIHIFADWRISDCLLYTSP